MTIWIDAEKVIWQNPIPIHTKKQPKQKQINNRENLSKLGIARNLLKTIKGLLEKTLMNTLNEKNIYIYT